jgi:pyridoxamine 5'-phosphate oxidase
MSLLRRLRALFAAGRGFVTGLSDDAVGQDPLALFDKWLSNAKRAGIFLPESMTLATCASDGSPSARQMLLKGVTEKGFAFYTNFESRKAEELTVNPRAALVFHWPILERQVRVEGPVERLSKEESEAYFQSRPRGSQIGAWASRQSWRLENREEMERKFKEYEQKHPSGDLPLPPFWGGYRLRPLRIEFWQGRLNRLHDRVCFTRRSGGWEITRLYP